MKKRPGGQFEVPEGRHTFATINPETGEIKECASPFPLMATLAADVAAQKGKPIQFVCLKTPEDF